MSLDSKCRPDIADIVEVEYLYDQGTCLTLDLACPNQYKKWTKLIDKEKEI